MVQQNLETSWKFFKKINIQSLYYTAIPILGIYSGEKELYVQRPLHECL